MAEGCHTRRRELHGGADRCTPKSSPEVRSGAARRVIIEAGARGLRRQLDGRPSKPPSRSNPPQGSGRGIEVPLEGGAEVTASRVSGPRQEEGRGDPGGPYPRLSPR